MKMKKVYKYIYICVLWLLTAVFSAAQDLPLMPPDPAVTTGVLPNGMTYYLVANPSSKGLADFALIQKTGRQTVSSSDASKVVSASQEALASLPRMKSVSPQAFLTAHGAAPGRDGFVKVSDNATLYHFDNVVVSAEEAVVDSTLLLLLDIADRGSSAGDAFLSRWYAPADQAVIISGDIDVVSLADKLRILSLMTPSAESQDRDAYVWQNADEAVFETSPYHDRNIATVSATWTTPRTPREYMNTIQPAIYRMFVAELGIIAKERLTRLLTTAGVPVADISFDHIDSIRSLGDESFTISLSVAPEDADAAIAALAGVMSSLDSAGAAVHEVEIARRRYIASVTERSLEPLKSNSEYVSRCAASFLYNSPLSSEKEILRFLKSRDLDGETEQRLFNNVAAALLDGQKNLTVECRVGGGKDMDSDHLRQLFTSSWNETGQAGHLVCVQPVDSMPLPGPVEKIKVKSIRSEHLTGGSVWTFANGFRVVYKRQDTGRRMYYSLAMNGGFGNIRNLSAGEGAYMTDYLNLCRVSGMSDRDFRLALEMNDISMKSEVNISNMILSGSAREADVELLVRILLAMANEREPDAEAFSYYMACDKVRHEFVKGSLRDRITAIDSLMCPDYVYSTLKTPDSLTPAFQEKAETFLAAQSGKMNDGILVLIGNIEETRLRKLLQTYVGAFRTTERSFPRTVVRYQPVSGSASYKVKGRENSVDMAITLRHPLTADNYMTAQVAAEILRQKVNEVMDGTGVYVRLSHNNRIYPDERFNVMITLEEASPEGFAAGCELTGFEEALDRLEKMVENLAVLDVTEEDVAKYKALLKGRIEVKMTDPRYWTRAVTMRYLDGKDLTTGYQTKIDAVTPEKVKALLASLSDAGRVEYIIEK